MFNKISNKIAVIILALLVISFSIFAFLSYNQTKNTMIDMTKNAKNVVSVADDVIIGQAVAPKIDAVNKLVSYLELNPHLITTDYGIEQLKKDFTKINVNAPTDEIFFGFASDGSFFDAILTKDKLPEFLELTLAKDNYDARTRDWYKDAVLTGGGG